MIKYEGTTDIIVDETLKISQDVYKANVKHFGRVHTATISAGRNLAVALHNAYHGIEAERLLTELASSCKRFHGPDHCLTQRVESDLQKCKVRKVWINFESRLFVTQKMAALPGSSMQRL
jgi:hypothetical protein